MSSEPDPFADPPSDTDCGISDLDPNPFKDPPDPDKEALETGKGVLKLINDRSSDDRTNSDLSEEYKKKFTAGFEIKPKNLVRSLDVEVKPCDIHRKGESLAFATFSPEAEEVKGRLVISIIVRVRDGIYVPEKQSPWLWAGLNHILESVRKTFQSEDKVFPHLHICIGGPHLNSMLSQARAVTQRKEDEEWDADKTRDYLLGYPPGLQMGTLIAECPSIFHGWVFHDLVAKGEGKDFNVECVMSRNE